MKNTFSHNHENITMKQNQYTLRSVKSNDPDDSNDDDDRLDSVGLIFF